MALIPKRALYPNPELIRRYAANTVDFNEAVVDHLVALQRQLEKGYKDIYIGMAGSKYVDREEDKGSVSNAWDFSLANFTADGNYHNLSLANIAPEGAVKVEVYAEGRSNASTALAFVFRGVQSSNYNVIYGMTVAANVYAFVSGPVPLNSNREIAYFLANSANWTYLNLFVRGWYI